MLLKKTLILPTNESELALRMFRHLVEDQLLAIFVAIGEGSAVETMVERADLQAAESAFRQVVWLRNPSDLVEFLTALPGADKHLTDINNVAAISISKRDVICDSIPKSELSPRAFRIFTAFVNAELSNNV